MLRIPNWLIGVISMVAVFTLFLLPYPYGPISLLLYWVLLGVWSYAHWKDDYTPGGELLVGSIFAIGIASAWGLFAPYFFAESPNQLATSILVTQYIRWLIYAFIIYELCHDYFRRRNWHHKKKWTDLTNAELPWLYIWNARCWGRDTNSPDDKTEDIDRELSRISGIYQEMKKRGIEKKILEKLLTHKDDGVRAMAARHLYWGNKERSMRVFDEIGAKNNLLGEDVRGWAKALREGKVEPDPE